MGFKSQSCGNCHFHAASMYPKSGQNWCLRFPPQVTQLRPREWPVVKDDDWCGEWLKRDGDDNRPTVTTD